MKEVGEQEAMSHQNMRSLCKGREPANQTLTPQGPGDAWLRDSFGGFFRPPKHRTVQDEAQIELMTVRLGGGGCMRQKKKKRGGLHSSATPAPASVPLIIASEPESKKEHERLPPPNPTICREYSSPEWDSDFLIVTEETGRLIDTEAGPLIPSPGPLDLPEATVNCLKLCWPHSRSGV